MLRKRVITALVLLALLGAAGAWSRAAASKSGQSVSVK